MRLGESHTLAGRLSGDVPPAQLIPSLGDGTSCAGINFVKRGFAREPLSPEVPHLGDKMRVHFRPRFLSWAPDFFGSLRQYSRADLFLENDVDIIIMRKPARILHLANYVGDQCLFRLYLALVET